MPTALRHALLRVTVGETAGETVGEPPHASAAALATCAGAWL